MVVDKNDQHKWEDLQHSVKKSILTFGDICTYMHFPAEIPIKVALIDSNEEYNILSSIELENLEHLDVESVIIRYKRKCD